MKELFEMYKNLDTKERIKFDQDYIRFNEEEKLKHTSIDDELNNVINEEGKPFSLLYIPMKDIFNVNEKLPDVEHGSFLVYAPKSFPKNSHWLVAEYYNDVKGFYSESSEIFLKDVTHWCKLPSYPSI